VTNGGAEMSVGGQRSDEDGCHWPAEWPLVRRE
jgi:hypothetical protein